MEYLAFEDADAVLVLLDDLEDYLDGRADADQPPGAACPIPNEAMSLLVRLRRLRATRPAKGG